MRGGYSTRATVSGWDLWRRQGVDRTACSCAVSTHKKSDNQGQLFAQDQLVALKGGMANLNPKTLMSSASREGPGIVRYRSVKPLIVEAIQVSGPADVLKAGGELHAAAGDWLVVDPQGNVRVCDDAYFRGNYSRLAGSGTLEEFRERTPGGGC